LGEGPIWHPLLGRLFWFDIINCQLLSATANGAMVDHFQFEEAVAAAGVIDATNLAIFSETGLFQLDLRTGKRSPIIAIEADDPDTRSNDSRVNPAGGFWLGTMSKTDSSKRNGSLYQYRAGRLDKLLGNISVPNSTCFSPDGRTAYFTGTIPETIVKCTIDPATGLPVGEWTTFASTAGQPGGPDGSVIDSAGYLWNARWNGSCVVRYAPDGSVDRIIELPVSRVTCPAFGGDDLKTLYITSAREGLSDEELALQPHAGSVFSIRVDVPGLPENLLKL
jgi:sugar lactone lactonase YvrE